MDCLAPRLGRVADADPLIVAGLVTLEICALTNFQLSYANIIALPVLLGVGVAFKIYYVTAWRRGESDFLELVLTHAVFYSTLPTATRIRKSVGLQSARYIEHG